MPRGKPFPDIELLLLHYFKLRQEPEMQACRFETDLPEDLKTTGCDVRINRITGTNRSMFVDRPLVDIDVYGYDRDVVVATARMIQQIITFELRGAHTPDGIIGETKTSNGPRWLPEKNQQLSRWGATYEMSAHAA